MQHNLNSEKKLYLWLHNKCFLSGLVLLLLLILGLCLHPWYVRYIAEDHRQTCEKARFVIEDVYAHEVHEELDAGKTYDEIDFTGIVKETVRQTLDAEVSDDLTVRGLCREGGVYQIYFDETTHRIGVRCSVHGDHMFFTWTFEEDS